MLKWHGERFAAAVSSAPGAQRSGHMFRMIVDYLMAKALLLYKHEEGASAIEYAIVVAMVAVVVVVFVTPLGDRMLAIFNNVLVSLGGTAQTRPTP
jgi:pilus assembly protein Flp/PilA